MAVITLRFLGEPQVLHDGQAQPLPPSKKTRALLAYLALNNKTFHRESLCELLWEIPDDPRGSLRWSLSKLRKLVDEPDRPRIQADRALVSLDSSDLLIDSQQLLALLHKGLDACPEAELIAAAEQYQGAFLEGLELDRFHDFYIWCMGEREKVTQAQAAIFKALATRLPAEQALPYARKLVCLLPQDIAAHARVIHLLKRLHQPKDAEQQYQLAKRALADLNIDDRGELLRVLHAPITASNTPVEVERTPPATPNSAASQPAQHLIGRRQEGERLLSLYRQVCASRRARVVLIQGEPGIGKSALMQAAVEVAKQHQAWVLHADAYESEQIRPFALWIDAFRNARELPMPGVLTGEQGQSRDAIFAALNQLFVEITESRPLAVLFDDVQWADESSAAALHYLVRMNRNAPVLIVMAARDADIHYNPAMQQTLSGLRSQHLLEDITLGPLDEASLQQIIARHADVERAETLSRESRGNPLLAIELARAAQGADPSGNSLAQLVGERFARMDSDTREVLNWAAVLEPRISLAMLLKVSDKSREQIEHALDLGARQG